MSFVKFEQQGAVGVVTIDRPKALNALNPEVLADLKATFEGIDQNAVRCVILTGEGDKSFVAGADIGSMSTMTKAEGEAFGKLGNDIFLMIESFPLPVIAAVNGFALGGGCELAMSCDIRICSDNAMFGQPEVGLGITPGFGGTQRLPRLVGMGMAKQLLYTARNIDAAEALRIGLVNAVVPQAELLDGIHFLNDREGIDGILIQFPLPGHLDDREIQLAIRPDKDVDCVHPSNLGDLILGVDCFWPCTPAGVMRLLAEYNIDPAYKNCAMVGRSNIVGKPQAMLLLRSDCTVTVCHTKTPDLAAECRRADILISAAGHPGLITAGMVKEGAVVIDVAVNRDAAGKLCGDVDYEAIREKASYITPVPGGVGPVTRAVLMENTLTAARLHGKGIAGEDDPI